MQMNSKNLIMNTAFLSWACIIAAVLLIIIIDAIRACKLHLKNKHCRLFEISKEREIFFIPGDPTHEKTDDLDYDDFEDL